MTISCLGIILIAIVHEYIRRVARQFDRSIATQNYKYTSAINNSSGPEKIEISSFGENENHDSQIVREPAQIAWLQQICRSLLYMLQALISYSLMLVFMTFNGYLMMSTIIGATLGFFIFAEDVFFARKAFTCH
ncbi:copper transpport protein [Basidiobolus ranarum]|uniref:Copper transport protein n=1 Tax=Basidiobolus ranarum TaxID=34480 RepID=A0ABR2W819_9FUNG